MHIQDLGELIRTTRKQRKLTQAQLAERSGVSRVRIIQLERGEVFDVTWKSATSLLEALDLTMNIAPSNAGRPVLDDIVERKDDLYDTPGLG